MKNVLIICLMLCTCSIFGQKKDAKEAFAEVESEWKLDNNGNVSFTKVIEVPGVSKDELYARALSYFTYNYKSGDDVIQVKDKEQGIVVGKGLYGKVFIGGALLVSSSYDVTHILRIDVKDNKARAILSIQEYKVKVSGGNTPPSYFTNTVSERFPFAKKDRMQKQMCQVIYNTYQRAMSSLAGLEKSLQEGNTNAVETTDW